MRKDRTISFRVSREYSNAALTKAVRLGFKSPHDYARFVFLQDFDRTETDLLEQFEVTLKKSLNHSMHGLQNNLVDMLELLLQHQTAISKPTYLN